MGNKSSPPPPSRTDWQHVVPLLVVAITAGLAAQTVLRFWAWWRSCTDTEALKQRCSFSKENQPPP